MGDENPIRTLGDYSKPSHEGYKNIIELLARNNVVPLRSDTIRLMQNGCSFHGLRSEDPKKHLKDFLKLVDSLYLDARSITTWEGLTTRFLAQFFPPGRTAKLRNDILMFQQHHGESLSEAWTRFKDLLQKVPHHGINLWLQVQIFYDHVNPVTRQTIDQSADVVPMTLTIAWKIPNKPLLKYPSSRTDEAGGLVSNFMASQDARLSKFEADFKQQQSEMTNKIDTVLKAITDLIAGALPSDTVKNPKLSTTSVFSAHSCLTIDPQCSSHPSTSINAIMVHFKEATISQTSLRRPKIKIKQQQPEDLEPTLEDEFQDLHLNLPVLEVLAHASIYNAILDKYVESLKLGKNGSAFVQGEISTKMEDPKLFTLPCRLGDTKPFDTLADLGSCVNIIPLYLFKKLNIELL
ncbi:MAK10-like protein [Tanacetum coccineum]